MPATYEPIASTTVGSGGSASIEFTSIPGTFTDLRFIIAGTYESSVNIGNLTFNNDTGSNYSDTFLAGDGSVTASGRSSSAVRIRTGQFGTGQGIAVHDIMSYANTNVFKTVLISSALPSTNVFRWVGLWRSTAAITSVKVTAFAGLEFAEGTTATLYGIKASA